MVGFSLYIKQKLDDIAVVHDVFLALGALQTLGLDGGVVEVGVLQILVGNDLGADEAALEVADESYRQPQGLGAALDGPGAALLFCRPSKLMRPSSS